MLRNLVIMIAVAALAGGAAAAAPTVDLSAYRPDSGITVRHEGQQVRVLWPMPRGQGLLDLDLRPGQPLIRAIGLASHAGELEHTLIASADPVTFLLVGERQAPAGRPPGMSVFNTFFDSPATRPFRTYRSQLTLKHVRVSSVGQWVTISIGDLQIGPFAGALRLTFYGGTSLVHIESVVHTQEDRRAILYDTGLVLESPGKSRFAWLGTEGKLERRHVSPDEADRHLAVRHRALVAETDVGSVACFPPPHQFFFPRDQTDNLQTVWFGRDHRGLESRFGFGIRQAERGGGSYVPWFNAPAGTDQRLGVFYLVSDGNADRALQETLRFTRGDRYQKVPGYHTFTSHWHMAATMSALERANKGLPPMVPDSVRMFKDMGVEIVHLAEFHGDGHPGDPGDVRLRELEAMFAECKRLSDGELLVLPGEEANIALGDARAGKEAGHWLYLFPKPVYWTMKRSAGQPFAAADPRLGLVFHVANGHDMVQLLTREGGLAWTSHARIKGSSWTPDFFRDQPFFRSNLWLGAAWKAMPADLSLEKLGMRGLDLLDDMANWVDKKYLPGEVDVFKIDHTHELFGHMNINYIRLEPDRVPRFEESWQPVLDSLKNGRFFVTTGEVLIPEFTVDGKRSGSSVVLKPDGNVRIDVGLDWTFPLRFAEIVSGDGREVYRERLKLSGDRPFNQTGILSFQIKLAGRKWVRLEAWDIATDGAFTQPVWLTAYGR